MITTNNFTLNINGYNHGFFQGGKGIRQGDLVSTSEIPPIMQGVEAPKLVLCRRPHDFLQGSHTNNQDPIEWFPAL